MKNPSSFLIEPDDSAAIVEKKLRDALGSFNPASKTKTFESNRQPSRVGRPQADWYSEAYRLYVEQRRLGQTEQQAVGLVADHLRKEEDAVRKAMRTLEKEWILGIYDPLWEADFSRAAALFTGLAPHVRKRAAKRLNISIRIASKK